jgi:ParB-like chromosome segregation protein Spo0J
MTEGLREPILVRESAGQYYVVDGHRRQRALARTLQLRIAAEDGKFIVYDGGQPLRDGPGPVHPDFDPRQVPCRLADPAATLEELFTSRLLGHRGKPFTLLERQVFLSRALRQGGRTTESLALKAGFSPAEIAGARQLNAADPRLLDQVRDGRISSQLVLRLLRTVPPPEQIVRLKVARAAADRDHREKLMARDFEWAESDEASAEEPIEVTADPVHARLHELVARLGDTVRFAPNPASEERLGTLLMIHRYALGKIAYERLEAHLLGRQ